MSHRLASLALLLGSAACAEPTEVVVFVDTSLGVPCQIDRIQVVARSGEEEVIREADPAKGVQSVTIIDDGAGPAFSLEVIGYRGQQVVARAAAPSLTFQSEDRRSVSVVLDDSCRSAVCDVSQAVEQFRVPGPAQRTECGGISDRYAVATTALNKLNNACELGTESETLTEFGANGAERRLTNQNLLDALQGFEFRFYGDRIQNLWIADDGYLGFSSEAPGALARDVIQGDVAASGAPHRGVLAFWDDLGVEGSTSQVCVTFTGAAPERTLLVTWDNVCFQPACAPTDKATFTVGLFEGSNQIVVQFDEMASPTNPERAMGQGAAVGIRGIDTPNCSAEQCNLEGVCSDGRPCGFTQYFAREPQSEWPTRIRFTPVEDPS